MARAHELGLEIALDFALQASPDHPWVTDHPEWFSQRADGSIAYAENPPKKYQDIYPINFDRDKDGIYAESLRILRYWMSHGVRIFRVDNPHTKPVDFWAWILGEVRKTDPDVLFLAEAFTKPAMMHMLGKVGFQQSYTYFTWRNEKWEIEQYMNELTKETDSFFRPNFWVNTPDILPSFLQWGGADGLHHPGRARRDAVPVVGHVRRLRAVRERGALPRSRGVPGLGEVPVPPAGLGGCAGVRGVAQPADRPAEPDPARASRTAAAPRSHLPPCAALGGPGVLQAGAEPRHRTRTTW